MADNLPIEFVNFSNEVIPSYAVMKVQAPQYYNGKWVLQCVKPDTDFERYYLINGPCRLKPYALGSVYDIWPRYALCDTADVEPAFNQQWGAKSGSWKLAPYRDGFTVWGGASKEVVGVKDGGATNLRKVLVRQRELTQFIGKLVSTLSQGSSTTAKVWIGAGGSESDSGYTITVRDWLLPTSKHLDGDITVKGDFINGIWYITAAGDCPKS